MPSLIPKSTILELLLMTLRSGVRDEAEAERGWVHADMGSTGGVINGHDQDTTAR